MRLFLPSLVLVCVITALAAPSKTTSHVVHERRVANPGSDWTLNRRLSPTDPLPSPLRIGLKQSNLHHLEDLLLSVSHPVSPTYGQHWFPEKVKEYFAPSMETIDAVREWLGDNGIVAERVKVSKSKGWVEVSGLTVGEVEELLGAEYYVFEHESGTKQISCESYSVPEHVREHIDLIKPTVHFIHAPVMSSTPSLNTRSLVNLGMPAMDPGPKTNGKKVTAVPQAGVANCDEMITLDCLRALYSIDYMPVATDKNSFGIVELTPQAFLAGDLDVFFSNFSPSQVGQRPTLISIDGGIAQTENQSFNFNGESSLDLEYGMGLTNPQTVTLLQTGDTVEGGSFDNWLDAVDGSFCTFEGGDDPDEDGIYPDPLPGGFKGNESCGIIAPPNVISTSYGQDEVTFTPAYVQRQCAEYGKLGMMGTTVIYSSGDRGVAGRSGCLNAGGPPSANGIGFSPQFPVVCPFVTAVGATQIVPTKTVNDPESACETVIFSGGGFSNVFPMPSYQSDAVTKFLTDTPPPYTAAQFNNSGKARGYPDLSANGANYVIGVDGTLSLVFGTSASAPVTASIITLINDARIAAGKSSVGFINPAIYSTDFAGAFNDITNGTNQGCGTVGFSAVPDWDPVTGVGTPNLTALIPLFLALP